MSDCSADYRKQIDTVLGAMANGLGWEFPVHAVTRVVIEQFKADGLQVLASTTVRTYMLVLRRFFAHLHQNGWIRRNPTLGIKLPKARGRKDHLRRDEIGPVLDAFWALAPDTAPVATALILGGWRRGEVHCLSGIVRYRLAVQFQADTGIRPYYRAAGDANGRPRT